MHRMIAVCFAAVAVLCVKSASSAEVPTASLERVIPLGDVKGRIDHLAIDLERQRLFVAELGNDTVAVVDLKSNRVTRRIAGFHEPQGLAYLRSTNTLYVANGGDGSVRLFAANELNPAGVVQLGDDADNVRIDQRTEMVFVGYGSGAIAIIEGRNHARDIRLGGHPEGFQIAGSGTSIYVNVPDARQVVIADSASTGAAKAISIKDARANFPMALDEEAEHLLVVFRDPPLLRSMTLDGRVVADVDTCRDADDVFVDRKRHRIYVICGQGTVDVFGSEGTRIDRIATSSGARTGLFVSELDRLFVAVPARGGVRASILVFRASP